MTASFQVTRFNYDKMANDFNYKEKVITEPRFQRFLYSLFSKHTFINLSRKSSVGTPEMKFFNNFKKYQTEKKNFIVKLMKTFSRYLKSLNFHSETFMSILNTKNFIFKMNFTRNY